MSTKNKRIIKRIYYLIEVEVESPIAVSSGEKQISDKDVIKNGDDMPFVPGSSLAGAFRSYIQNKKQEDCGFGFAEGEKGRMSSVYISDMMFSSDNKTSIRDNVSLKDDKSVENKFDQEIVEPGDTSNIFMECVIRENDSFTEDTFKKLIKEIAYGIDSNEIRIGANKNRGFGRLGLKSIKSIEFTSEKLNEWLEFDKHRDIQKYETYDWKQQNFNKDKYYKKTIELELQGGISIRKYSTKPRQADYEHITSNSKPVIPGTSWNGAIRSDVKSILKDLGCTKGKIDEFINKWFGNVDKGNKEASASRIVFNESIIKEGSAVPVTRNKINRFDASTIDGALYSEIAVFGGKTKLEMMIVKDNNKDYYMLLAILELVLKDLCQGFLAVGGLTAVGRGIFSGSAEDFIDDNIRKEGQKKLIEWLDREED